MNGGRETILIGDVLTNETDALFSWQFRQEGACPKGCERNGDQRCRAVDESANLGREL